MEHENRKLIRLVDVETQEALWLWYPCIRAGKITIAEGDPGAGKAMRFPCSAAAVPSGALLPLQAAPSLPPRQPRRERARAHLSRILPIDEGEQPLSVTEGRLIEKSSQCKEKTSVHNTNSL